MSARKDPQDMTDAERYGLDPDETASSFLDRFERDFSSVLEAQKRDGLRALETDFVRQALQSQVAFVDKQLSELEPGQTLCVHEVTSIGDTLAVSWPMHVLAPGEECDRPDRRQQYGPAPADWRSIVEAITTPAVPS